VAIRIRRREFIATLSGAAATWPCAAHTEQAEQIRRIGVLMRMAADDSEAKAELAAFLQGLQALGWTEGRNVRIDTRWAAGDSSHIRRYAAELVTLKEDVILASGGTVVEALQQASRTVPIVFVDVTDPVGRGYIASLAQPGSNATGFTSFEYSISVKWLELLKQIEPSVTRVAVLRDPSITAGIGQWAAIHAVASSFGVEVSPIDVRNASDMEHAITAFSRRQHGGLIASTDPSTIAHRDLILALAARYQLPAVYPFRYIVAKGGLAAYGPDILDQCQNAAAYVDRILKGVKPAELPVQAPTKFELVINLKTAKALGLEIPPPLLARADEVIE
jgi:putative ABC transport system substrate-binding protein